MKFSSCGLMESELYSKEPEGVSFQHQWEERLGGHRNWLAKTKPGR